ncbi:MAG: hypothetical protein BAJALOKI3v1_280020 [Promethearchaeota archaeon]|jgi:hypothetical protein|nr:MAG: hypothetical protein BAJALOKI3v1_280020 [Candidatus Lokiarchaeota archaeon]
MVEIDKCKIRCNTEGCWKECEDYLKEKINRSKYVKDVREHLMKKRREKHKFSKIS